MGKKILQSKFWLVAALSLIFIMPSTDAFAWGWSRSLPSRHEVVVVGHERYHYHAGRFYRPGFFGFVVVAPPLGAIIRVLPFGYRTLIRGGATYYYYDNVYYAACPSGYVVVTEPMVSTQGERVTINVPNSNGSYTPVTLIKHGNGYIGPQGEYYESNPTVNQLKALYGK